MGIGSCLALPSRQKLEDAELARYDPPTVAATSGAGSLGL